MLYFATEHGHHVDVACQPSALPMVIEAERVSERASEIAATFRTMVNSYKVSLTGV